MARKNKLLLAYYGDDFTGSTDALEFLSRAGIKTVLFITPPAPDQLNRYKGLQAIGIAGMTRAMTPPDMENELLNAFSKLKELNAPHVHYKVCSTFDSSPYIGSIGKAIETGLGIFRSRFVPLLVAAPALGRYCTFGNLFARMGIGSQGDIYRLDRHPSMSKHPVTPSTESDLRKHLARQTQLPIGLVDILTISGDEEIAADKLEQTLEDGSRIVLFDALHEEHMLTVGGLIDSHAKEGEILFSVGSSGIEMALGKLWQQQEIVKPVRRWQHAGEAGPILVLSGSCSPVTEKQIDYAVNYGFTEIALDTEAIAASADVTGVLDAAVAKISASIKAGTSVVVHTSRGAHDERIDATYQQLAGQGLSEGEILAKTSQLYGTALGMIALKAAAQTPVKRVIIAGGDTAGYVARTMDIESIEMLAPLSPGAPLCLAHSTNAVVDGLQVNFKGGQVGAENYFVSALKGELLPAPSPRLRVVSNSIINQL